MHGASVQNPILSRALSLHTRHVDLSTSSSEYDSLAACGRGCYQWKWEWKCIVHMILSQYEVLLSVLSASLAQLFRIKKLVGITTLPTYHDLVSSKHKSLSARPGLIRWRASSSQCPPRENLFWISWCEGGVLSVGSSESSEALSNIAAKHFQVEAQFVRAPKENQASWS